MGLAGRYTSFNAVRKDNSVYDVIHAREYVDRVFVLDRMPTNMSCRGLLTVALDLLEGVENTFRNKMVHELLSNMLFVLRTTVHSCILIFSDCVFTLLTGDSKEKADTTGCR